MRTKAVNLGGNWIHDNGALPKRIEKDIYETPQLQVEQAYQFLLQAVPEYRQVTWPFTVLDVGAGRGVWGQAATRIWPDALITGSEIRELPKPEGYDLWEVGDFLQYEPCHTRYDLVIGNPPYYCDGQAMEHALQLLKPGGHLLFLLKLTFITGKRRLESVYQKHGLKAIGVYSNRIKWHSLNGDLGQSPPRDHALFLWQKDSQEPCKVFLIGDEEKGIVEL